MNKDKKEMTDAETEKYLSQKIADNELFFQWCKNLWEINRLIHENANQDKHHCRWFYIALSELLKSGSEYATNNKEYPKYALADIYIQKLMDIFTEDEYFMLQYYRHSASHIFQHNYGYLDNNDNVKTPDRKHSFYGKNKEIYKLTINEIFEKANNVIGEYGYGEPLFKSEIIRNCYPILLEWEYEHNKRF